MNTYLRLVAQPMHLRFQFRKSRANDPLEQGLIQVLLVFPKYPKGSITYGPYSTPIETTRNIWDSRRSIRPTEKVRELNRQLAAYQSNIEASHAHLSRQIAEESSATVIDGPTIMDTLKRLQLGELSPISLFEIYQQFYQWKKSVLEPNRKIRKKGQISEGTLRTYPKRWSLIHQFLLYQKRPKLPVASVNFRFATELKEWMQRQKQGRTLGKGYDPATVHKVIGLLKMLLTYAQSKEYIRVNVLASFTTEGGSVANPKPLTRAQMHTLETCDLPPVLRHACDSWLVAAELCFHYADYMELPNMKFVTSESGVPMVQHDRVKQTGTRLLQTVNITARAERILSKYNGPRGLYYTSSAYFSKLLKKIARLADLRDADGNPIALQFGQGRDTGLTTRGIEGANNVQLSKMAGWANAKESEKYLDGAVDIVDSFARKLRD